MTSSINFKFYIMTALNKTIQDLTNQGYTFHHSASKKIYCRRDMIGTACEYNGRFGCGFIVFIGRYHKSKNFSYIAYFLK